jgi:hypothetical protein
MQPVLLRSTGVTGSAWASLLSGTVRERVALHGISRRGLSRVPITVSVAAAAILAGCGGTGRSSQAFCSTLNDGTAQLRAAAQQSMSIGKRSALLGLITAFGNIGNFEQFLDRLNKTAPSPIESDMNVVDQDFHDSIENSGKAAGELLNGNPVGLAEIVFKQLVHANSYRRVDEFAAANCGTSIFAPHSSW